MKILKVIPGPLLIFFGVFCLSFGGLIVKSFETTNLWQILFWRQIFFAIIVLVYLILVYKKKFLNSFYSSGLEGFLGGFILAIGFAAYVFSMYKTTVANANFIITTETIFLAFFGYIFLKEKISLVTLFSIFLGMVGVILILGSSISIQSNDQFQGNIVAFLMPISFAILVIVIRKNPRVDMIPAQFTAGIVAALIGWAFALDLSVSTHDLFLALIAGFFQVGFGFILITIGSQKTSSAVIGVIMLSEAVFGPLWAWLFINETIPISVLFGGAIIIFSILFLFFNSSKISIDRKN